ncbi:heavy-metal-associated domain-containing protein [Candidatus Pacearchaeota archaeon]|nr:heavy-metal-associated domain-containing protein [Candidatus Pacearchaeota archaeon]
MKKAFIIIEGMDCASDSKLIERSLLKVKGVKSANVNYLIHKGFINVDNNVTKKELEDAVKRVGYTITNIRFVQETK